MEYKVKSIRADDETYEKFKAIASQEFGNQGQCLSTLINLYETEQSKVKLIERKLEINSFQSHLNKIGELFLMSLQLNQDAEERVRTEFEKLLESKDRLIIDLQTKVDTTTLMKEQSDEYAKRVRDENKDLYSKNVEVEKQLEKQNSDYEKTLADKDSLNKALTDSCNERKSELDKLHLVIESTTDQLKEFNLIKESYAKSVVENSELARSLERIKDDHASELLKLKDLSELEKEKALIAAEKVHQQELKEANGQHNEEIKDYINRMNKMQDQHEKASNAQLVKISELEKSLSSKK